MSRYIKLLLAVLIVLAGYGLANASTGHEPRWADFGWRIANLVLFCGILWYFTGKIIKRFFKNRKETIVQTLDDLEKRRSEEKEKLAEIQTRIANLESERKKILDDSKEQGERLKQNILADANRQAKQIIEQAQRSAENEGRAMMDQVRATIAAEIIEAAGKALSGRLTSDEHDKLIANALNKVTL